MASFNAFSDFIGQHDIKTKIVKKIPIWKLSLYSFKQEKVSKVRNY
jgi:hypothetical protein